MTEAAEAAGGVNMVGFNYVCTPATQALADPIQSLCADVATVVSNAALRGRR